MLRKNNDPFTNEKYNKEVILNSNYILIKYLLILELNRIKDIRVVKLFGLGRKQGKKLQCLYEKKT